MNSCKLKSQGYGKSKMATWLFLAPWQTSFFFAGLKPSLVTELMPSQWQKLTLHLILSPSLVNWGLCLLWLTSEIVPSYCIILLKDLIELLKKHAKFVPKAYLINLSLDRDKMPCDLQPENYTLWKRHNSKGYHQPGQTVMEKG